MTLEVGFLRQDAKSISKMRTVIDLTTLKFKKSYIKIQVKSQDTDLGKMFAKLIKVNLSR